MWKGALAGWLARWLLHAAACGVLRSSATSIPACPNLRQAEEPSDWESSDDGGYDPEGATFHGGRQRRGSSGGGGSDSDGW